MGGAPGRGSVRNNLYSRIASVRQVWSLISLPCSVLSASSLFLVSPRCACHALIASSLAPATFHVSRSSIPDPRSSVLAPRSPFLPAVPLAMLLYIKKAAHDQGSRSVSPRRVRSCGSRPRPVTHSQFSLAHHLAAHQNRVIKSSSQWDLGCS